MTSKTTLLSTRNILMRNLVLPALVAGVFLLGLPGSISAYQLDKNRSKWEVLPVPLIVDNEQDANGVPVILNETAAAITEWNTAGATFFGPPTTAATDLNGTNFRITGGWGFLTLTGDKEYEVVYEPDSDLAGSAWDQLGLNRDDSFASAVGVTFRPVSTGPITDAFVLVHGSRLTAQGGDLQALVTHELGHVLGVNHSSVLLATSTIASVPLDRRPTMSPGAMQVSDRTLEADDKAAVVDLYGIAGYAKIVGTVKRCGTDAPVVGANVRAVVSGNQGVQVSRLTGFNGATDGTYEMMVPAEFQYTIVVEPVPRDWLAREAVHGVPTSFSNFAPEYMSANNIEGNCVEDTPEDTADAKVLKVRAGSSTRAQNLQVRATDVAFAIDTSASMDTELSIHARDVLTRLVDDWEATQDPFPAVAIQTFAVSPQDLLVSNDPVTLRAAINDLVATGGTGCGEASNDALQAIGPMLGKGSVAVLLTDEPGNPNGPSRETLAELYRVRGASIRTLLTGDCGGLVNTATTTLTTTADALSGEGAEDTLTVALTTDSTLGVETATATFSALAAETGGSFLAIDTFGEPYYKQAIFSAADSAVRPAVAVVTPWLWVVDGVADTIMDVEFTGANTNFNDTSTLSFDVPDIIVNSMTVESPRRITANLTVLGGSLGKKMTVTTDIGGGEVEVTVPAIFQSFRLIPTLDPRVTTLTPPRAAIPNSVDGITFASLQFDGPDGQAAAPGLESQPDGRRGRE